MNPSGIVADIQRYSLHDGPGIRTVVFFKGCPLECQWCANPETQSFTPDLTLTSQVCIGCDLCAQVCPNSAISIIPDDPGKYQPSIRWDSCDACLMCADVCVTGSLTRIGISYSASQLLSLILLDQAFYARSGGGLTLSGGEPALQPIFADAILRGCKANGIHTAMETSGSCQWETLDSLLPVCDLIYFDIKHIDQQLHEQLTGRSNELILRNFERAVRRTNNIIVRFPIIPGLNDSDEHVTQLAGYLKSVKPDIKCEVVPYHRLGSSKYKNLGRRYILETLAPVRSAHLGDRRDLLRSLGVSVASR